MAMVSHHHTLSNLSASVTRINPRISHDSLPGFDETVPESRSANYAFIKGPEELSGMRVDDPKAQGIILKWLEDERARGRKLVGAFDTSLTWLFEVTPNSVRFITDD